MTLVDVLHKSALASTTIVDPWSSPTALTFYPHRLKRREKPQAASSVPLAGVGSKATCAGQVNLPPPVGEKATETADEAPYSFQRHCRVPALGWLQTGAQSRNLPSDQTFCLWRKSGWALGLQFGKETQLGMGGSTCLLLGIARSNRQKYRAAAGQLGTGRERKGREDLALWQFNRSS